MVVARPQDASAKQSLFKWRLKLAAVDWIPLPIAGCAFVLLGVFAEVESKAPAV